jgi:hypothetical protein
LPWVTVAGVDDLLETAAVYHTNVSHATKALRQQAEYVQGRVNEAQDNYNDAIAEALGMLSPLRLRHLLGAVHILHAHYCNDDIPEMVYNSAHWLIADHLEFGDNGAQSLTEIIAFARHYPEPAVVNVLTVVVTDMGAKPWSKDMLLSPLPGELTKAVFTALKFERSDLQRSDYLQGQLAAADLSAHQHECAAMLAEEWVGTLDELIDTAAQLARTDVA